MYPTLVSNPPSLCFVRGLRGSLLGSWGPVCLLWVVLGESPSSSLSLLWGAALLAQSCANSDMKGNDMSDSNETTTVVKKGFLDNLIKDKELSTEIIEKYKEIRSDNKRTISALKDIKSFYEEIFEKQKIIIESLETKLENRENSLAMACEIIKRMMDEIPEESLEELGIEIKEVH